MTRLKDEMESKQSEAIESERATLNTQYANEKADELSRQKAALCAEFEECKAVALKSLEEELATKAQEEQAAALEALRVELHDNKISVLEARVVDLEGCKAKHENELEKMDGRLRGALAALESEKEEVSSLQQKSTEMEKSYSSRIEGITRDLESMTRDKQDSLSKLEVLNAQLSAMRDAQNKSEEQQMQQISDASKAMEESRQQVLCQQNDIESLKAEIKAREARISVIESQLLEAEYVRRQLHNQVQELRGNVRVFCRVRPAFGNSETSVACIDDASLKLTAPSTNNGTLTTEMKDWSFSFDKIFDESSTQQHVFDEVSQLVQSALDGYKVCLFSYGQTGSGKTYTMLGNSGESKGIIARSVEKIIEASAALQKKGWEYSMEASFVEIYNETIRDLLQPGTDHSQRYTIQNERSMGGCPIVSGVLREAVSSVDAANSMVRRASAARAVEATRMNDTSSRSHTIFMLYITGVHKDAGQKLQGCLNLVDLAGSERVARSGAEGARLKESCSINKSLSALGDVFTAISNKQKHIPFRNSKLTHLLSPCLSGDGKALMFSNISPQLCDAEETLFSLRFAAKVNACELGARGGGARRNITSTTPADTASADVTSGTQKPSTGGIKGGAARRVSTAPVRRSSRRPGSS